MLYERVEKKPAPASSVAALLFATYAAGSVLAILAYLGFMATIFMGSNVMSVGLLIVALIGVAIFYGIAPLAGSSSPLAETGAGRFVWACAVTVVGSAGTLTVLITGAKLHLESLLPLLAMLAGLPYAFAAALFVSGVTRWVAIGIGAVVVTSTAIVISKQQAGARFADQLDGTNTPRDQLYVTSLPGYGVTGAPRDNQLTLTPIDQSISKLWQDHDVQLTVSTEPMRKRDCGPSPIFGPAAMPTPLPGEDPVEIPDVPTDPSDGRAPSTCVAEAPGLWYRTGLHRNEYVIQRGRLVIRAGAGDAVSRNLLRQAILGAHRGTDKELKRLLP